MLKLTLSKKKFLSDLDRNYLKSAPIHRRFTITPPKPLSTLSCVRQWCFERDSNSQHATFEEADSASWSIEAFGAAREIRAPSLMVRSHVRYPVTL